MKKLWLLKPREGRPEWQDWYNKVFGFVVRAETEEEARYWARDNAENEDGFNQEREPSVWVDPSCSSCEELTTLGHAEVVLRDFRGA